MKMGHWPKNGTVGTRPGRVRDMSRTSATKELTPKGGERLFGADSPVVGAGTT